MQCSRQYIPTGHDNIIIEASHRLITSELDEYAYLVTAEKELSDQIRYLDYKGARNLLYNLQLQIFYSNSRSMKEIVNHAVVLIAMLYRALIVRKLKLNHSEYLNPEYYGALNEVESFEKNREIVANVCEEYLKLIFDYNRFKHSADIQKVMEFIRTHWRENLTLAEIADNMGFNKSYLSSFFNRETGISISDYTNQIRVQESKQLLKNDNISLVEIAMQCGFYDQSYFSKIFNKWTGMTPGEFRVHYRQAKEENLMEE